MVKGDPLYRTSMRTPTILPDAEMAGTASRDGPPVVAANDDDDEEKGWVVEVLDIIDRDMCSCWFIPWRDGDDGRNGDDGREGDEGREDDEDDDEEEVSEEDVRCPESAEAVFEANTSVRP